MKRALQIVQILLFAGGAATLALLAVALIDARAFQRTELARFPASFSEPAEGVETQKSPPTAGESLGRLDIPRLGISVVVVEGTSPRLLRRAAGHIVGTALPGTPGNAGVSAHRDTFFRPLRDIRANDLIHFTTARGEYNYRVLWTRIVSPSDLEVLDSVPEEVLTLVTCYPFYYVGPAPRRFIVRAERIPNAPTRSFQTPKARLCGQLPAAQVRDCDVHVGSVERRRRRISGEPVPLRRGKRHTGPLRLSGRRPL